MFSGAEPFSDFIEGQRNISVKFLFEIGSVAYEEMSFKVFIIIIIFSSGGHFVQPSGSILGNGRR